METVNAGRIGRTIVSATLIAFALLQPFSSRASSQGTPVVAVDPATLTVAPDGGSFEVHITVDDVTDFAGVGGYTLVLNYDPDVVMATKVEDSGFIEETENIVLCPSTAIDDDAGRLAHFCFTVPVIPEPGPRTEEPEPLAIVTFEPVGSGTTVLEIGETELIDPQGEPVEAATENGEIVVGTGTPAGEQRAESAASDDDGGRMGIYIGLGVGAAVVVGALGGGFLLWTRRRGSGRP